MSGPDLKLYSSNSLAGADGEPGHDALGGYRSSDEIESLRALPLSQLTGVVVSRISGLVRPGLGSFQFVQAAGTIAWKAPGDTNYGTPVIVAGGLNRLDADGSTDKWIVIDVTLLDLPAVDTTDNVTISLKSNVLFDDVKLEEAQSGKPNYRAFFVKNEGAAPLLNFRAQFDTGLSPTLIPTGKDYPPSGSFKITLGAEVLNWPASGFMRNVATAEIMYYSSRQGNILSVPATGRALRDTSAAAGAAADAVEAIGPTDVALELPNGGGKGSIVLDDRIPPAGIAFFHPTEALPAQGDFVISSLAVNAMALIWMRRWVPPMAANLVRQKNRLLFLFD